MIVRITRRGRKAFNKNSCSCEENLQKNVSFSARGSFAHKEIVTRMENSIQIEKGLEV